MFLKFERCYNCLLLSSKTPFWSECWSFTNLDNFFKYGMFYYSSVLFCPSIFYFISKIECFNFTFSCFTLNIFLYMPSISFYFNKKLPSRTAFCYKNFRCLPSSAFWLNFSVVCWWWLEVGRYFAGLSIFPWRPEGRYFFHWFGRCPWRERVHLGVLGLFWSFCLAFLGNDFLCPSPLEYL